MRKITELLVEQLNACVKYLSVNTCVFLIAQFLMCLLFICSVTLDLYKRLDIINDTRQRKTLK